MRNMFLMGIGILNMILFTGYASAQVITPRGVPKSIKTVEITENFDLFNLPFLDEALAQLFGITEDERLHYNEDHPRLLEFSEVMNENFLQFQEENPLASSEEIEKFISASLEGFLIELSNETQSAVLKLREVTNQVYRI